MTALLGLRTVINFIVKLHSFLAGEEALAQPRPLLALHRILLLILQQKQSTKRYPSIIRIRVTWKAVIIQWARKVYAAAAEK
jgi:hypothetical protein